MPSLRKLQKLAFVHSITLLLLNGMPQNVFGEAKVDKHKKSLESIQKEIGLKEKELKSLLKKENSVVKLISELDKKIDKSKTRQNKLQDESIEVSKSAIEKQALIASLEKDIAQSRDDIENRLRALYQLGDMGYLRLLLGVEDLRDFSKASFVVRQIVENDLETMKRYQESQQQLIDEKEQLLNKQKELAAIREELADERQQSRQQKKRQQRLLTLTRDQRDFFQKSVAELKVAQENLEKLIKNLTSTQGSSAFAKLKGSLPLPIVGKVIERFGPFIDPKFSTKMRSDGIAIKCTTGKPVLAIYDGKVIYADWFTGFGKIVIVDHGDGYYALNAHLDQMDVKVGQTVRSGDTLGLSGGTGSLKGPRLYFEIRHQGRAIDPLPWFGSAVN